MAPKDGVGAVSYTHTSAGKQGKENKFFGRLEMVHLCLCSCTPPKVEARQISSPNVISDSASTPATPKGHGAATHHLIATRYDPVMQCNVGCVEFLAFAIFSSIAICKRESVLLRSFLQNAWLQVPGLPAIDELSTAHHSDIDCPGPWYSRLR